MSKQRTIIWIDDEPNRIRTANLLAETSSIPVCFENVKNKDLGEAVNRLLEGPQPALVVLDHILDQASSGNPMFRRGSTIAQAVKEQWPTCPVIGVTNIDRLQEIDIRTRGTYDDLYPLVHFGKYMDRIDSVARDFAKVARSKPISVLDIIKLLRAPNDDISSLEAALPQDLKEMPEDGSVASRLYRWVKLLLRGRPGFLYDAVWSATFLGLNQKGFSIVQKRFGKAMYKGVFAVESESRWWKSALSDTLYEMCPPATGELTWHVGRRLPRISPEHFSKCYVCDGEYPDIVAFLDAASDEQRPMHSSCTVLHPNFKRELYFEDIRIMRGE